MTDSEKENKTTERKTVDRKPAKISVDAVVKNLIVDGQVEENITILYGFFGEENEDKTNRFYFDPLLKSYIDVDIEDIIYHRKLRGDAYPFDGTAIWLRNAHKAFYPETNNYTSYFQGNIMNNYIANAQGR